MIESLPLFLATGAIAGVIAGLFGVGGGLIMVPALAFLLPPLGVAPEVTMQIAIGTSLAIIGATSVSSLLAHHRRGGVVWPLFWQLVPGLAVGAVAGAFTAHVLDGTALKRIVGASAILVSIQMVTQPTLASMRLPGPSGLATVGTVIGWLAALIGIGGGALTVPFLSACQVEMRKAVGTSAACGMPIAWAGAAGFVVAGWGVEGVPGPALGYVSLSAFGCIAVASVLTAPLGARLAHHLPPQKLKRAFAGLLLLIGLGMLFG